MPDAYQFDPASEPPPRGNVLTRLGKKHLSPRNRILTIILVVNVLFLISLPITLVALRRSRPIYTPPSTAVIAAIGEDSDAEMPVVHGMATWGVTEWVTWFAVTSSFLTLTLLPIAMKLFDRIEVIILAMQNRVDMVDASLKQTNQNVFNIAKEMPPTTQPPNEPPAGG